MNIHLHEYVFPWLFVPTKMSKIPSLQNRPSARLDLGWQTCLFRQSKSQTMKYLKTHKCRIYLLFQSLFLICSGLFWLFIFPVVFKEILDSKLIIKEGTPAYDAWKKPSLPTTLRWKLYLEKKTTNIEKPKFFQSIFILCGESYWGWERRETKTGASRTFCLVKRFPPAPDILTFNQPLQ